MGVCAWPCRSCVCCVGDGVAFGSVLVPLLACTNASQRASAVAALTNVSTYTTILGYHVAGVRGTERCPHGHPRSVLSPGALVVCP